jgi:hypothetical protein
MEEGVEIPNHKIDCDILKMGKNEHVIKLVDDKT